MPGFELPLLGSNQDSPDPEPDRRGTRSGQLGQKRSLTEHRCPLNWPNLPARCPEKQPLNGRSSLRLARPMPRSPSRRALAKWSDRAGRHALAPAAEPDSSPALPPTRRSVTRPFSQTGGDTASGTDTVPRRIVVKESLRLPAAPSLAPADARREIAVASPPQAPTAWSGCIRH